MMTPGSIKYYIGYKVESRRVTCLTCLYGGGSRTCTKFNHRIWGASSNKCIFHIEDDYDRLNNAFLDKRIKVEYE